MVTVGSATSQMGEGRGSGQATPEQDSHAFVYKAEEKKYEIKSAPMLVFEWTKQMGSACFKHVCIRNISRYELNGIEPLFLF